MTTWTPARTRAVRRLQEQRRRWRDDPVYRDIADRAVTISLSPKRADRSLARNAWIDAKKQLEREQALEAVHPLTLPDGSPADIDDVIGRDPGYLAKHLPSVERALIHRESLGTMLDQIETGLGAEALAVAQRMREPVADTAVVLGMSESKVKRLRADIRALAAGLPALKPLTTAPAPAVTGVGARSIEMAIRPKLTSAKAPANKPIIQTTRALLALRDSGFSLSTALAEVVDNSIEAKAKQISIDMNEAAGPGGRAYVDQIAIADDGDGMNHDELWDYLVIGHSSRWMSKTTIGKYGVGAKLAALNFAKRIDVWSRQGPKQPWLHVMLDLNAMMELESAGGTVVPSINKPTKLDPPRELSHLAPDGAGTIVVWSDVDRLEAGRVRATFDELLVDVRRELSRIFREFIANGLRLAVNKRKLKPNDPLYLMSDTVADDLISEDAKPKPGDKSQKSKVGENAKHFEPFIVANREPIPIREA